MKKLLCILSFFIITPAYAFTPFVPYTQLTAAQLNAALAAAGITSGTITGATIDNSAIGSTTPSTGNFTALSINGAALASLYAPIAGNSSQTFSVANATAANQAVALGQLTGTASLSPNFSALTVASPDSFLYLNKDATTNASALQFKTAGTEQWAFGTNQGTGTGSTLGIYSTGGAGTVLTFDNVTGAATFGSTVQSTNIVAGQTVSITQPVSGTVYQNTNAFSIDLYEPITYNATSGAAATDEFLMGSTNTPSAVFTNSEPATSLAGIIETDHVTVPPGWYYEWTVANAALGTPTAIAGLR